MRRAITLALTLLSALAPSSAQTECGMTVSFTFPSSGAAGTPVRQSSDGSLLYGGPLAIDLDGAPNAYHPNGRPAGALDTICNGANAILPDGTRIRGDTDCGAFIARFNESRDAGWVAPGKPRIEWFGVATQGDAGDLRNRPCVQEAGSFKGFFVAQTALLADPSKDRCSPERYMNSAQIPFFVLPRGSQFLDRGMKPGDLGVAFNEATGAIVPAVFADIGPRDKLGEGSLALALLLKREPPIEKPAREHATKAAIARGVHLLLFPGSNIGPPYTSERIAKAGQERLTKWGGPQRLQKCVSISIPVM